MMDASGSAWGLVWVFLALFVAGLILSAWALSQPARGSSSAHDILAGRLARGEITPEEYAERRQVLGEGRTDRSSSLRPVGVMLVAVGLVGALVVLALDWGGGDGWWGHMRGPMMGGSRTSGSAPAPVREAPEVRVLGTEFAFSPDEIQVEAGETVNLVFDNRGAVYHTFTIPDLDFELTADGGRQAEGALTASSPATYEIVCVVAGHSQAGMRGRLVVGGAGQ